MKIKGEIERVPMQVTDSVLKQLYARLCSRCNSQQLVTVNMDRGSCNEAEDYVQETMMTLVSKLKADKVSFNSFSALWAWCCKVLGMRLMRHHRDYSIVQSRTARTVDIDGEFMSGTKVEDAVGLIHANIKTQPDALYQANEYNELILAYSGTNAQIVPISELFKLDSSCTVISVAKVLDAVATYGLRKGLKQLDIPKISIDVITDVLVDYIGIPTIGSKTPAIDMPRVLGSRDKEYLKQIHKEAQSREMISIEELEHALCLNNN